MDVGLSKPEFVFADFRLDPQRRLLLHNDEIVILHPRAFDLLLALVENRDRVLSKNELLEMVWAEQFVEENNLAVQIFTLRKIFAEKKCEHRFIVTVPGKGYRFVAEVKTINQLEKDFSDEPATDQIDETAFIFSKAGRGKVTETGKRGFAGRILIVCVVVLLLIGLSESRFQLNEPDIHSGQLKLSRLTASGKITNAVFTPDGKYAVYAQKESTGESLWLKQIETGSQARIAEPQMVEYVGLAVSPDDKYIYFSVFLNNQAGGWLRRMPLIGGTAQEISGIESGVSVSFAPDGKQIAFTESSSSSKETRLNIANADGSNSRFLIRAENRQRYFPTFNANPAAWSPDGLEIACSVNEKTPSGMKAGILLVDPVDGGERFLLEPQFAWIDNLYWADTETLAFVASETDEWSSQVWTVSRKTGETRQITNDLQKYQWLSAANGYLLTIQQNSISNLQIADFEEDFKELKPREVLRETDIDYVAFGADNSIYYVSRASGKREVWRVGKNGATPAQITSDAQISYGFAISAKDESIVFTSAREGGKHSLWKVDGNGGNFRRLTDGDDLMPQISADGERIIFQRGLSEVPTVWSLNTDAAETATQLSQIYSLKPAISPDGSQTAYFFMDSSDGGVWRVGLISTETGAFLRKLSFPMTVNERRMRWHPSGKFLTFLFTAGENLKLMLLPIDGGSPKIIDGLGKGEIDSFDWSPDGKKLIFSKSDKSKDAVLLTGF